MGLISKVGWIGVGYVLGARAGTGRYDQIVGAGRYIAKRPELQAYLKPLLDRLNGTAPAQPPIPVPAVVHLTPAGPPSSSPVSPSPASPGPVSPGPVSPGPVSPGPVSPSPVSPSPVSPSPVSPSPVSPLTSPAAGTVPSPGPAAVRPLAATPDAAPTPAAVPGRGRVNKRPGPR